ncbi:MAG TPA: hypothetical protein VK554_03090 [Bradyrhizobium sp.]|nr:hypothetical protein [Bradyrhizobium sp.]
MMLALDLAERITERFQEVFVCGDNRAIQIELDHSLRLADRVDLRQRRLCDRIAPRKHLENPLRGRINEWIVTATVDSNLIRLVSQ